MLTLSAQSIVCLALCSAGTRAGLNVVDRYLIGKRRMSVVAISCLNNIGPAVAMCVLSIAILGVSMAHAERLVTSLWSAKWACSGALIQLTAYAFSFSFRVLTVNQVTVATKLADLFIPIAIVFMLSRWSWEAYGFACLTTALCLPLIWGQRCVANRRAMMGAAVMICVALVLQATLLPILAGAPEAQPSNTALTDAILTATSIIVWRTVWSLLPLMRRAPIAVWQLCALRGSSVRSDRTPPCSAGRQVAAPRIVSLLVLRSVLTVVTQTTFIFCVTSPASNVAWPVLNSAGFFAMLLSMVFLHDALRRREVVAIGAITALSVARLFWL